MILADVNQEGMKKLRSELAKNGSEVIDAVLDVTSEET